MPAQAGTQMESLPASSFAEASLGKGFPKALEAALGLSRFERAQIPASCSLLDLVSSSAWSRKTSSFARELARIGAS